MMNSRDKTIREESELDDFIEGRLECTNSKYVTDKLIKGRRIALYNIGLWVTKEGDKPMGLDASIPNLSGLITLATHNHRTNEFRWTGIQWETER